MENIIFHPIQALNFILNTLPVASATMSFPNRITKDTSARKGPAALTPHDAALQAYMQTFINSIHDNTAAATHARHSEHLHDSQALKACFIESYNDAVRKLNRKFADDWTALNAERDKKVAELRREFANDPLGSIMAQQNAATSRNEQKNVSVEQRARMEPANVAAGEPRAAAVKQEPGEEATPAMSTCATPQERSVSMPANETANASSTSQSAGLPSEHGSVGANALPSSQSQPQNEDSAAAGIGGGLGDGAGQGCQDLVEVKSEVIQAGLENRGVRADSVVAMCKNQVQETAPLDACPGTHNTTDRSASSSYVDLTAA